MALDITIQKSSIPAPHEKVVVSIVAFWIILISILYFLPNLTIDQWKLIIGFVVNINLLFFYGAPLSTIYTVVTSRDSSSIHRPTMVLNTICAVFWTAFGFGVMDWFIIVPNGLGAILGFVQMMLRLVVPSRYHPKIIHPRPTRKSGSFHSSILDHTNLHPLLPPKPHHRSMETNHWFRCQYQPSLFLRSTIIYYIYSSDVTRF